MSEHQHREKIAMANAAKTAHPTQNCSTCTACVAAVNSIECHASPPVGVPIFQADAQGRPVVGGTVGIFPPCNAMMWCRHYEERPEGEVVEPLPQPRIIKPPPAFA